MDLAAGALSRFAFSICVALAAIFASKLAYLDLLLVFSILAILSWGGHLKDVARIALFAILPVIFVFMLHSIFNSGTSLAKIWFITVTVDGVKAGIFYSLKLLVFAYAGGIIFLTVDPFDLVSPLERLARISGRPGRWLGAMALSIFLAIRFLPEMVYQGRLTMLAFKSRGLDMKGGLIHKARVASLIIPPMFVSGYKRAESAAAALNAKGYATRYSRAVFGPARITMGSVITILISAVILVAGLRT